MSKKTQLEMAKSQIEALKNILAPLFISNLSLQEIVDEAQNSPPDGGSDGSLNEDTWNALNDLTKTLNDVRHVIDKWDFFVE